MRKENQRRTNIAIGVGGGLAYTFQNCRMSFMIPMGKVETRDVHPRSYQYFQVFNVPARRPDRTDDLRAAMDRIRNVWVGDHCHIDHPTS